MMHVRTNLSQRGDLSLRRVEIRREMALRVHFESSDSALRCPRRSVPIHPSNLQLFGKAGQNFAAGFRNRHYVFLTRAAHAGIVQAWFDCEHLTIFQNDLLQTRMLVYFQAKPMAGAVEKSDATPIAHLRRETATGEKLLDRFVNNH